MLGRLSHPGIPTFYFFRGGSVFSPRKLWSVLRCAVCGPKEGGTDGRATIIGGERRTECSFQEISDQFPDHQELANKPFIKRLPAGPSRKGETLLPCSKGKQTNSRLPVEGEARPDGLHCAAWRPPQWRWQTGQDPALEAARATQAYVTGPCWLLGHPGWTSISRAASGLRPHSTTWMHIHDLRALLASEREQKAAGPQSCRSLGSGKILFRGSQNGPKW